jgi:hypothetical protein
VMMRKMYQDMVMKQQQITPENAGDKPVQIQGLSSKKSLPVVTV